MIQKTYRILCEKDSYPFKYGKEYVASLQRVAEDEHWLMATGEDNKKTTIAVIKGKKYPIDEDILLSPQFNRLFSLVVVDYGMSKDYPEGIYRRAIFKMADRLKKRYPEYEKDVDWMANWWTQEKMLLPILGMRSTMNEFHHMDKILSRTN